MPDAFEIWELHGGPLDGALKLVPKGAIGWTFHHGSRRPYYLRGRAVPTERGSMYYEANLQGKDHEQEADRP